MSLLLSLQSNIVCSQIKVAVASSAKTAILKLAQIFRVENQDAQVEIVTGSTGKLVSQIENGAPFHILMAADSSYPAYLEMRGYAASKPIRYATGNIIVWTNKESVSLKGTLSEMLSNVDKIALASQTKAPYGKLAVEILQREDLLRANEDKIIVGASIAQVNQYIMTKSVDLGFTARSTVFYRQTKGKGRWIEIPNASISQYALITKYAKTNSYEQAKAFFDLLISERGQLVFKEYGYKTNR